MVSLGALEYLWVKISELTGMCIFNFSVTTDVPLDTARRLTPRTNTRVRSHTYLTAVLERYLPRELCVGGVAF
jgi:hypothetical protein